MAVTSPGITTIDPATEEPIEQFALHSQSEIDAKLDTARRAYADWRFTTFAQRGDALKAAARVLREQKARLAEICTREMGKPIVESEAEVEKCAICCDFYAERGEEFLRDELVESNATQSLVGYRPLGVLLAIMPWNFPYWQAFRAAVPALMAGNTVVLKHSSNVTRCALEIERVFHEAGFPHGAFTTLIVPGGEVKHLIADRRIACVTLTGSENTGRSVASAAGEHLKKSVLELGGSDAFIVLADADLDAAAQTAARARFQNTGQSCIAAKRFIVEAPVHDEFVQKFVAATQALPIGNPSERNTKIGPMSRGDLRDELHKIVDDTLKMGATAATGGRVPQRKGYFLEPTIVTGIRDDMPMFRVETFGPAAAVSKVKDVEEAIALANDSDYGLGGNLWTRDIERAKWIAARLETGGVFINGMTASDPRLPFGGVKSSGYGRELSWFGIREFVNIQTVWIGPMKDHDSPIHHIE